MAKQTVSAESVIAKLGDKFAKAHEVAKKKTTVPKSGGDLPSGVNGVAHLVECKLGLVEKEGDFKGQPYFYAAGVVVLPKFHTDGQPIEGLRTSIMEMLCETPGSQGRKTVQEHVEWMYEQLRGLGVDTSKLTSQNLGATLAALEKGKIHFRFHTWKPPMKTTGPYANKESKLVHLWDGAVQYTPSHADATPLKTSDKPASTPATKTAPATTPTQKAAATTSKAATPGTKTKPKGKPAPEPEPEENEEEVFNEFQDSESLNELAEKADGGDEEASDKLTEIAVGKGITEEQITEASSWTEVVDMINGDEEAEGEEGTGGDEEEASEGEEGEEEAPAEETEEERWVPEAGQMYQYHPIDPKKKKPSAKAVDVKVKDVNEEAETVTLVNMSDRKTLYKNVKWTDLKPAE